MDVPATYICPICGRKMKSPQGLAAHMRAHKAREEPQEPEKEEKMADQKDVRQIYDELIGRFAEERPGLLQAPETEEERKQRIRQNILKNLVAMAEIATRVPSTLPLDTAAQMAEKLGDGNLKSLVYLTMLHHLLSSCARASISIDAAFRVVEKELKEQGILKEEESLRELVPEITLSNVIEQLSRRIGRLE